MAIDNTYPNGYNPSIYPQKTRVLNPKDYENCILAESRPLPNGGQDILILTVTRNCDGKLIKELEYRWENAAGDVMGQTFNAWTKRTENISLFNHVDIEGNGF